MSRWWVARFLSGLSATSVASNVCRWLTITDDRASPHAQLHDAAADRGSVPTTDLYGDPIAVNIAGTILSETGVSRPLLSRLGPDCLHDRRPRLHSHHGHSGELPGDYRRLVISMMEVPPRPVSASGQAVIVRSDGCSVAATTMDLAPACRFSIATKRLD